MRARHTMMWCMAWAWNWEFQWKQNRAHHYHMFCSGRRRRQYSIKIIAFDFNIYSSLVRNSIVIFDSIYFLPSSFISFEINLRRIDCLNDEPNDFRVSQPQYYLLNNLCRWRKSRYSSISSCALKKRTKRTRANLFLALTNSPFIGINLRSIHEKGNFFRRFFVGWKTSCRSQVARHARELPW